MLPYKTTLKPFARNLRSNLTGPEKILWSRLPRKQMSGLQFYRQKSIAGYIVDFYCAEAKLVIELDGDSHYQEGAQDYDRIRDACMQAIGLKVLRFLNSDIVQNLESVLDKITNSIKVP